MGNPSDRARHRELELIEEVQTKRFPDSEQEIQQKSP